MKRFLVSTLLIISSLLLSLNLFSQDRLFKLEDVQNPKFYPKRAYDFKFIGNTDYYTFTKDGKSLLKGGAKEEAKEFLKLEDLKPNIPNSFIGIKYISDNEFVYISTNDNLCVYDFNKKTSKIISKTDKEWSNSEINYNNGNIAFKKDNNLYILKDNKTTQITFDGTNDLVYGEVVHRNEFGIDKGLYWSNDGEKLAFYKMDQSMVTDYPLVNTGERIAKNTPVKYPMAGMKSHEVLVGIYDINTNKTIYLKSRKDESVEEREMYLTNIVFSPDSKRIYIQKLNRLQNHLKLEAYNSTTGELEKVLFEEKSNKYVEPEAPIVFLPNNPNQFLFLSERDNWNHIYLYDINGNMIKKLTEGKWMVNSIEGFNSKGDEVFFYATKDSPLDRNFYGVNIKSGKIKRYSIDNGTHTIAFNSKGNLFIDSYSNYTNTPFASVLLDSKGKKLYSIFNSEDPLKNIDMPKIEVGTIKSKDNTDLYYRMYKPHNFDPNHKYPVLVYVYGGPHAQLITNSWLAGGNNFFLFLAQQGFIVWTLDSRGSANRGFEFESSIWHNLGVIEVSDQMDGVEYLKKLPYVDANRIGVDGWSYGGFMTISLKLKNPGVFKTATAGGPVIDWKWYEIMYGERYMGNPENNLKGYKEASLLNHVDKLEGKLMIIQGAQDNVVVPQHAIEFINKCIKNQKQVDFFLYPDHEHNVRGKDRIHLYRKIYQYHKENL